MRKIIYFFFLVGVFFFLQGSIWKSYLIESGISALKHRGFYFENKKLYFLSGSGRLFTYNGRRIEEKRWFRRIKGNLRFTSMVSFKGNIFLGTENNGLLWVDSLHNSKLFTKKNASILDNRVKKVLLDSTHRIVLLHSYGLSFGYLKGKEIEWRPLKLSQLPPLNDVAIEKTGNLWLATEDGLYAGSEGKWYKFGNSEGLEVSNIRKILLLEDKGQLWVWGKDFLGKNELYQWEGRTWKKNELPRELEIRDFFVWDNSLWLATNKGIYKFYKGHWAKFAEEEGVLGVDTYFIGKGKDTIYFEGYGDGKVFLGEMDKYFLE